MSVRNYQNYESGKSKSNTAKYNAVYQKLAAYKTEAAVAAVAFGFDDFHTSVITGAGLRSLVRGVAKYQKRDCFALLKEFVTTPIDGKIGTLYGLRRTGKTTLIFQMISELPVQETAYIKVKASDNMSMLTKDLQTLYNRGCRYVFIDEVTLMDDFIGTAALLSDVFAAMGMKIVLSGTDSLGFAMANRDELYDRNVMIHTSFIPFREYARLLGIDSVDKYIEYGGTLKMENMGFDDPDSAFDDVSFRDDESTRKYIDTAISRNIQHSLKNDSFGEYFNQLRELYEKGELTNVINRIVQNMNHRFLLSVVQEKFKSQDFGSARNLLLHDLPDERAHVLYDVNEQELLERLKVIIEIKEKSETTVPVTENHIEKIKKYLFMLDLLVDCTERYEHKGQSNYTLFSQPGMRYAIAKALVFSLRQDEYFATRPESEKAYIADKILCDVKGRMLEDIVLLETSKVCPRERVAFRFKFEEGGEYDMVVCNKNGGDCRIYEIKHSEKTAEQQTRYLRDENKLAVVERRFGKIVGKYVLYRGATQDVNGIRYLNVEEYLKSL